MRTATKMPNPCSRIAEGAQVWRRALIPWTIVALTVATGCSDDAGGSKGSTATGADAISDAGDFDTVQTLDLFTSDLGSDATADTGPAPGTFGYPCQASDECNSGLCIDSPGGKICTKYCTDSCPSGFACTEETIPGTADKGFYCSPKYKFLCDPCENNDSCNEQGKAGSVCMQVKTNAGVLGGFCGAKCNPANSDCPSGFECLAWVDEATGLNTYQCTRAGGEDCTCSNNATELGLKTPCTNKNLYGSCTGYRQCTATGLSACSAPVAKPEECNGKDDDCNGKIDDFQAGAKCDIKNEFGTCKGQVKECVDGQPVCEGPAAKPEACNGIDDNCDGETDEGLCEDGDPCTKDKCNTDGSCQHVQLGGLPCDDGSICTTTDKCVQGKCFGGGELNCDDKDSCTADSCNPIDGCQHKPTSDAVCPDDGVECTQDLCKDGKCVHPQASDGTKCSEDGKPCTADICKAGKCDHPLQDGIACVDDGKPCTTDVCEGGTCKHNNATGIPCDDGDSCTMNDSCLTGNCKPGQLNLCDDGVPCTKDSCIKNAGCIHDTNGANGMACIAGSSACPAGVCNGGGCVSKPNEPCQAEVDALCDTILVPGVCTNSGKCMATQKVDPATSCPGCNGICVKCAFLQVCCVFSAGGLSCLPQ